MMKRTKLLCATMLVSLLISFAVAAAGEQTGCKFIMGYERWEPYQYQDQQGNPIGLDIELISAILKNARCGLVLEEMPWKRHLYELKEGTVHLAPGASKTPERESFAYFSQPYRTESVALYVRKGEYEKFNFTHLNEIVKSSFALGVTLGYYYGEEYAALMKTDDFKRQIQEVPYDSMNYDKLMAYRIDGFLADPIATATGLKQKNFLGKIEKHPMRVYAADIFVMFSKKSTTPDDVDRFNKNLDEMKTTGQYDEIMNKYFW